MSRTAGWALTSTGLYWTRDGGGHWSTITPPGVKSSDVSGVGFSGENGTVAVNRPTVTAPDGSVSSTVELFMTADAGATWRRGGELHPFADAAAVHFAYVDATYVYALMKVSTSANFDRGVVYRYDGQGWAQRAEVWAARAISFADRSRGVIVGGPLGDTVLVSLDGGASWSEPRTLPKPAGGVSFSDVALSGSDAALAATGTDGLGSTRAMLFTSTDSGNTWKLEDQALAQQEAEVLPAALPDPHTWVVSVADRRLLVRSGRGRRTVDESGLPAGDVEQLVFADDTVGWAIVVRPNCPSAPRKGDCTFVRYLSRTSDGGASWSTIFLGS